MKHVILETTLEDFAGSGGSFCYLNAKPWNFGSNEFMADVHYQNTPLTNHSIVCFTVKIEILSMFFTNSFICYATIYRKISNQ